uniref:Uncharacterized protein n=1 Tax=Takifugu rubripes TaxID=31033 RepID=A0A674N817_TAKRU
MKSIENWVGTWRPHRPRGPIAALYSSPGPKYALPGLTGSSEHDPTKYKAPMFSMGMRHKLANPSCSPGPKYSMHPKITRKGHDGTPAFSIYKRRKDPRLRADRLNFHSVTLSKPKAPSFTFGIRHSQYISSLVVDEFNKRSLTNERDKAATALEPKAAW